jgi:membrane protein
VLSIFESIIKLLKKITLPGFGRMPIYDVGSLFYHGMIKGFITLRASSIAFSFILAFFPALIFLFTLIPYVPVPHFHGKLLSLIHEVTPADTYSVIRSTIEDIVNRPRGGLLSLGFILTLYFATNGISSITQAFNDTYHTIEKRSFLRRFFVSVMLVIVLSLILIIAISLLTAGSSVLHFMVVSGILKKKLTYIILDVLRWIIITAMFFFAVSFLYYYAPAKKMRFRFISAGSVLSTFLYLITSLGFNYYISHFSRYNKIYGSIGTLMLIMFWIYFNSVILLIGFELNTSISNAMEKKNY